MSKHVKEFEFSLGDRVIVKEIQRPGVVEAIQIDNLGIQYRVYYWDNSERKFAWLYSEEIELRKS